MAEEDWRRLELELDAYEALAESGRVGIVKKVTEDSDSVSEGSDDDRDSELMDEDMNPQGKGDDYNDSDGKGNDQNGDSSSNAANLERMSPVNQLIVSSISPNLPRGDPPPPKALNCERCLKIQEFNNGIYSDPTLLNVKAMGSEAWISELSEFLGDGAQVSDVRQWLQDPKQGIFFDWERRRILHYYKQVVSVTQAEMSAPWFVTDLLRNYPNYPNDKECDDAKKALKRYHQSLLARDDSESSPLTGPSTSSCALPVASKPVGTIPSLKKGLLTAAERKYVGHGPTVDDEEDEKEDDDGGAPPILTPHNSPIHELTYEDEYMEEEEDDDAGVRDADSDFELLDV